MKAIDNFDTTLGVRFSTYAVPMIIGEIRRYLRDNNAIRVSRSLRDTAYKALQLRDALASETQREPTVEELAEKMGIDKEEVVFAWNPSRILYRCLNRSITITTTRCTSWIRSAMKRTATKTGSTISPYTMRWSV
jgi:DNA-directed RNA polymerase specialized sigma subunit